MCKTLLDPLATYFFPPPTGNPTISNYRDDKGSRLSSPSLERKIPISTQLIFGDIIIGANGMGPSPHRNFEIPTAPMKLNQNIVNK